MKMSEAQKSKILTRRKQARLVTLEELKYFLDYDPETGIFVWKNPTSDRMKPGDVAGRIYDRYISISINYKMHSAQHLAWLYVYGEYPENNIDHINKDTSDNRISNLRDVTDAQNNQWRVVNKNNVVGYKGVKKNRNCSTWMARIKSGGQEYYLGSFKTKEEAALAYNDKARELFGEFAYLNEVKP